MLLSELTLKVTKTCMDLDEKGFPNLAQDLRRSFRTWIWSPFVSIERCEAEEHAFGLTMHHALSVLDQLPYVPYEWGHVCL